MAQHIVSSSSLNSSFNNSLMSTQLSLNAHQDLAHRQTQLQASSVDLLSCKEALLAHMQTYEKQYVKWLKVSKKKCALLTDTHLERRLETGVTLLLPLFSAFVSLTP